ncbi:ankyrin repeat domain-containing protein [Xylanimonas oleitrophica]|uniref:Ankyrin repeat domain-containing protein n=1 Tax=Xylanimonas oleitrophica TaxID=2607479 RepID=A0A2W5X3Y3_9MICO|nr:ankyrin repeat domain-containing protein [Xylanimonas oleitrophica]PZR55135.1 ankyrin repeat domain-containing protein [Xylanimonas oleitrophica]
MSDANTPGPDPTAGTSEKPDRLPVDLAQMFDLARAGADLLLEFVDAGVDPNLTNEQGDSLLMLAAYHGHAELVRGLAARGADVDALNLRGQSPLAGAVFKANDTVIEALVELGADPDVGVPTARQTAQQFGRTLPERPVA